MESIKIKFWLKLGLVIATSFIVINYIFKPSDNQCQMTFMMEPPKFIPIPIEASLYDLNAAQTQIDSKQYLKHKYRLFMYSEFGFPLEEDMRRDLKDSMPVLFVPGNAGSYQQVRSLASTCIRRQLQSLDAFKFIFYTIDFQAQLSGLNGELVEDQIDFLNLALHRISNMHPSDTSGVIVIGHSVGGFVAKALLARKNFQSKLVPLLINLASPITRPFVNFDLEMQRLYAYTNARWSNRQTNSSTLTISITGGKSDRLVPAHLSLDPQYDISLTTSSTDGVWLATDHVSITWCRELMNKLSRTLSALMDKKHTRLIEDRAQQLAIVKKELLTLDLVGINVGDIAFKKESRMVNTNHVKGVSEHFSISRVDLLDSPVILNLTSSHDGDLFIWLEHIDDFKDSAIIGCEQVHLLHNQARCDGKVNLIQYFWNIPSRRYELKKKILLIRKATTQLKYLTLDFSSQLRDDPRRYSVPESIHIQFVGSIAPLQPLYMPTISSYFVSSFFGSNNLYQNVMTKTRQPKTYAKYEILNFDHANQYYNIIIESSSCPSSETSSETIALLILDKYISESFYVTGDSGTVMIKLSPQKSILMDELKHPSRLYLELFIDGTCKNSIKIKFDIWGFLENLVQSYPGEILTCSCYLAYTSILTSTSIFLNVRKNRQNRLRDWLLWFAGFTVVYSVSKVGGSPTGSDIYHQLLLLTATSILSSGLVALVEYVLNRLVDLATIVNNFQTFIRNKVVDYRINGTDTVEESANINGVKTKTSNSKQHELDYEWIVVPLTVIGSSFLSEALMRLCILFMMLKLKLKLSILKPSKPYPSLETIEERTKRAQDELELAGNKNYDRFYNLVLSVTVLSIISSICSIPSTLLKINSTGFQWYVDQNFLTSLYATILAKCISQSLESMATRKCSSFGKFKVLNRVLANAPRHSHILSLVPIAMISRDIRAIKYVELTTLVWVASTLSRLTNEYQKKRKSD